MVGVILLSSRSYVHVEGFVELARGLCGDRFDDHGLRGPTGSSSTKVDNHAGHAGHDHPSEGPHGGELIDLGKEEYHAELVHDDATHTITIYVLDGSAKVAMPIEATEMALNLLVDGKPQQFKLPAKPEWRPRGESVVLCDHGSCVVQRPRHA